MTEKPKRRQGQIRKDGKTSTPKEICPKCGEYLKTAWMLENRKYKRVGLTCPNPKCEFMQKDFVQLGDTDEDFNEEVKNLLYTCREYKKEPENIIIATQDPNTSPELIEEIKNTDFKELINAFGGEVIKLGGAGHAFNPFKDASEEQIKQFLDAYCEPYPEEFRAAVWEKLKQEIEKHREEEGLYPFWLDVSLFDL